MIETDRLIAPQRASPQEEALERALRPKHLGDYVGQEKIRCCSARQDWARPRWPTSSPGRWA
jgi:hypothetical protein